MYMHIYAVSGEASNSRNRGGGMVALYEGEARDPQIEQHTENTTEHREAEGKQAHDDTNVDFCELAPPWF